MLFNLFNERHVLNSNFQYLGGQRSAISASCDKKSTLLIMLISYSRTGVLKVVPQYPQGVSKLVLGGIQKGILENITMYNNVMCTALIIYLLKIKIK